MKAKVLCIILALAAAAACFSACGKAEVPADTTVAPVVEEGEVVDEDVLGGEEDGQNIVMNFVGNYQSDRRTMLVEAVGMNDEARVTVRWGADAWTQAEWVLTGKCVQEGDTVVMKYTDGQYAVVKTDENGSETRSDEKSGLTGTIVMKLDGTVTWTDDQDEEIKDLLFEWVPVAADEEAAAQ